MRQLLMFKLCIRRPNPTDCNVTPTPRVRRSVLMSLLLLQLLLLMLRHWLYWLLLLLLSTYFQAGLQVASLFAGAGTGAGAGAPAADAAAAARGCCSCSCSCCCAAVAAAAGTASRACTRWALLPTIKHGRLHGQAKRPGD